MVWPQVATLVWILGAVFLLNVLIAGWLVGLELIERRRLDKEIKEVDTLWRSLTMPQTETAGWGSSLGVEVKQRTPVLHRLPAPPRTVGKASVGLAVAASVVWVLVAALGPGDPPSVVQARGLDGPLSLQKESERQRQEDASDRGAGVTPSQGVSPTATSDAEGVPATVAAQPRSSTAIHLDWAGVTAATSYEVERLEKESPQGWLEIIEVPQSVTSYVDGGLDAGTTYFYRVSAMTESGAAMASDVVSATTPGGAVPTAPSVTAAAALDTITLTWIDVSDETGYRIERSPDGTSGWAGIGTAGQNVTVHTDSSLDPGTSYYYRIVATNSAGDSAPSEVVSATTETDKTPEPPEDGTGAPSPNGTPAEDVPPATDSADGALAGSSAGLTEVVPATESSGGTLAKAVPPVSEVSVVLEPTS
jgi:fibronectin type 3 domain-containing protein